MHDFRGSGWRPSGLWLAVILALAASLPATRPARAGRSEDRLVSITKTTIYGAALGGLLGLASALVVKEGDRDKAVRWGLALGAFGGFAYGVVASSDDDSDLLSALPRVSPDPPGGGRDLVRGWRLGSPPLPVDRFRPRTGGPELSSLYAEVIHGEREEEAALGEEEACGRPQDSDEEDGRAGGRVQGAR